MKKIVIYLVLSLFVVALNVSFSQDKMDGAKKTEKKKGKKKAGPGPEQKKM